MTRGGKLVLLGGLYLAQGLPFGFFTQALPVLMREAGLSLKAIGATSLLFLPWALKFLWAGAVDHVGTRRQWILPLQLAAALGAALLALAGPGGSFAPILAALLLFNLLAAMQDVATDGLAVTLLSPAERGLGNGLQVGAYRIGMILGGGLLLWVFAVAGWAAMYWSMSALLALCALPVLLQRGAGADRSASHRPPARVLAALWWRRAREPGVPAFLLLICAYKLGDAMVSSMVGPFMVDAGLGKGEIALVKGTIGSTMGLAGAALGGWCAWRFGRRPALLACGLLQTASLLLYVACAAGLGGTGLIYAASTAEHLLGGMATVALFTLMMDASEPDHAGTDYTLYASTIVIATGAATILGGLVADAAGYAAMFALGTVLSGLGCVALLRALDRGAGPRRLDPVWQRAAA